MGRSISTIASLADDLCQLRSNYLILALAADSAECKLLMRSGLPTAISNRSSEQHGSAVPAS